MDLRYKTHDLTPTSKWFWILNLWNKEKYEKEMGWLSFDILEMDWKEMGMANSSIFKH